MTQIFHGFFQSKSYLLIVLMALLYSTQTKLEAQNCTPPANVTVTCEQFDPSLLAYGNATIAGCLDTVLSTTNYSQFNSTCNKGTIVRNFYAYDCSGNSSQCNQSIVVNYVQNYFVKFPNDLILSAVPSNGAFGEPTFFGENCELMGSNSEDIIFTTDPDANLRIERTWTVINWCTFDPAQPYTNVPNPNPNALATHPANLPGPIVSAPGTQPPWDASVVKISPQDATATDFSTFWSAGANGYRYTQIIRIVDSSFVAVEGSVFTDSSSNCVYETGEELLADWTVRATGQTSGQIKETQTDVNGHYTFVFDGVDTVVNITLASPGNFAQGCQTNYNVTGTVGQSATQDIPVHLENRCALLSAGIGSPLLRRCFNSRYNAQACNLSASTVNDTYVEVDLDDWLTYVSSSIPGTLISGNTYRFETGDLRAGECRSFSIDVYVNCSAPLGATHCTEAKVFPYDACASNNSNWSGADVDVSAVCDGDSIRFKIANVGQGAMIQNLDFVVAEDIIMREGGNFQLGVGAELDLAYLAAGSTWRLEAQEEPFHPFGGFEAVALEGCGGIHQTGLVNLFPLSSFDPFVSLNCQENAGSFDPNDKQAFPLGYGAEHFLHSNAPIEYMIRFQNTGTDTAFTVKVLDPLSPHLNPATVRVLATSHPVAFSILDGNVLQFMFQNILLPDSNVNLLGSNGFLRFRVEQMKDNPEGTLIENSAAIYFDFNDPVITNTTFHNINDHYLTVGINDPAGAGKGMKVYPNPTAGIATLEFENAISNGRFELKNQLGQALRSEKFSGNQYQFERANLPEGIYFFNIVQGNGILFSGKILVK